MGWGWGAFVNSRMTQYPFPRFTLSRYSLPSRISPRFPQPKMSQPDQPRDLVSHFFFSESQCLGQAAELSKPGPWTCIPSPRLISGLNCQVRDATGPQCPQPVSTPNSYLPPGWSHSAFLFPAILPPFPSMSSDISSSLDLNPVSSHSV